MKLHEFKVVKFEVHDKRGLVGVGGRTDKFHLLTKLTVWGKLQDVGGIEGPDFNKNS